MQEMDLNLILERYEAE